MSNMLLDHDHAELDEELARFFTAISEGEIERSFKHLDVFWARLAMHIRAENLHLFPALLRASYDPHCPADAPVPEAVDAAIVKLRDDHDFFMKEITAAVKVLRELQRGDVVPAASTLTKIGEQMSCVSERLEKHNVLEETEVYPWTTALLDETGQSSLSTKIQQELKNLPPRLQKS